MYVLLRSVGNPDHGQNPDEPLYGVPSGWVRVYALEEASNVVSAYIEEYDLGGGNWNGGYVFESLDLENQIAYISYNGRIWTEGDYMKRYRG